MSDASLAPSWPRQVLVIKPSSLGDVVHTLPAVAAIKRHYPEAPLRWVVNPEWAPLLQGNPHIDEVIIFPRAEFRGVRAITRFLPWARRFGKNYAADLVLDFQGLLRSGILSRCARQRASGRTVGLSDAREGAGLFYDETADVRSRRHAVDRYLALVEHLGIATPRPLEWPLPPGDPVSGVAPGAVLLHPFSRGEGKSLTIDEVAAICAELAPHPVQIVGRSELSFPLPPNATNLLNQTTLAQLIWLIRQARFVVSVDSGPMHIAAALTDQLLSIHTWSDPRKVGPYRGDAWVWKDGRLSRMSEHLPGAARLPGPPVLSDFTLPQAVWQLVLGSPASGAHTPRVS